MSDPYLGAALLSLSLPPSPAPHLLSKSLPGEAFRKLPPDAR